MPDINGWHALAVSVVLLCSVTCCAGFNVDIESAVVHHGPDNSMFGYRAEFIKQSTGAVSLLVSAPHQEVTSRDTSGYYYLYDPLKVLQQLKTTAPFNLSVITANFGEREELFGLTLLLVNSSTALICGPMWTDMIGWYQNYLFPVGRCQIVPPGTSTLSPLSADTNKYLGDVEVDGRTIKGYLKGFAHFGFSAATLEEQQVVVSTPGYKNGKGSFGVLELSNGSFDLMDKDDYDKDTDVYLGFALAAGNFCGETTTCFAVSNRMTNGKVYIVAREQPRYFRVVRLLEGPQDYSSFGFSLCAMDINGDGLSDLLVGAPTFSDHSKDETSYDEGRVFVYLQLQDSSENITLFGGRKSFARFGSAIGDIGDINRDSTHDVAVGAPQEDEGRGAVYIYLGSSKGPDTVYSQRISGRDVDKGLFSFGSHISKSTPNISSYKYPDFAVGSPESDAVVVLRTRLIINARVNIVTPPGPINSSNSDCPGNISKLNFKASGCIQISLCLNYSAENTAQYQNLPFDVSLDIDTLLTYDSSRRVRLVQGTQTVTSVRETAPVNAQRGFCKSYLAILREDLIFRNLFVPVKMEASFTLNMTSLGEDIKPILNTSLPTSTTSELRFLNKCGEDQTCNTDLVLDGRVQYLPPTDLNINIVNKTTDIALDLTVSNRQESAYGVQLTVKIQGIIRFRFASSDQGGSPFICESKESGDNTTAYRIGSTVACDRWVPLAQGDALTFRLQFDAGSVPLENTSRVLNFEVKIMPSDPAQNPEMDVTNNILLLNSTKAIVADVSIDGSSDPRALFVYDSSVPPLEATHQLLVNNRGPSFMPASYVNISIPYMDKDGRELLTSYNITIKYADGTEVLCPPVASFEAAVGTTATALPSTRPTTSFTSLTEKTTPMQKVTSPLTSATQGPEEVTFGPVDPSRRRRRQAGDEKKAETTESADKNRGSDRVLKIDCQSYRCRAFQCSLPSLPVYVQAQINVRVVIYNDILKVSDKVNTIEYTTHSHVAEPSTPFFYPWSEPRQANVTTTIHINTSEGVNIWIIIGGILGGIVLLIIIALILKKLGFFRREDKEKLQRLKRQSGYYDSRRKPPAARPLSAEPTG